MTDGPTKVADSPQNSERDLDLLFRRHSGDLIALLTRIFGPSHLELAEDVVQEAFIRAMQRWPYDGVPENPRAWLIRVARNQALDRLRRNSNFRNKQPLLEQELERVHKLSADDATRFEEELSDDSLALLFACCHPELSRDSQVTLVLKTVGGFSTREIARAFLGKPAAIAARLTRARARLAETSCALEIPAPAELQSRLDPALEALYLIFNEGYQAFEGDQLIREDLCREALRLATMLAAHKRTAAPPCDALCALFSFQAARLPARTDNAGRLVLLDDQDRARFDPGLLRRGLEALRRSASGQQESAFHLEAEIASCHSLAVHSADTDWPRILRCYERLFEHHPSPVVALNRAIALAHVEGDEHAFAAIEALEDQPVLIAYQPYWVTRGEFARRVGRLHEARSYFEVALELSASEPVRRYLEDKLAALD